ncbi:Predicted ATPase [Thermomonospora echinospora]|uniref:Predicted ATPase n=1 Tax=Thermomonospora echinospora TaxID=1992 RepID=A0A1H5XL40_9ACTN|nr:BTAD domain-containing putative transcriptional regulator [Thermomonospora echinospora]SEG12468.1 Predicted ATPase [Thermomonospora echinospora]
MPDIVRIGILGPVEVTRDGRPLSVSGARLRALLTLLALEAGRTVPAGRLIDDLWEDRPPVGASNALQSLVSRLRAAVGRDLIGSPAGGYRLELPREAVDAHAFESAVIRARAMPDPAQRSARLREALALWRGPALAEVDRLPFAEGPVARLEGLRRAALEERIDADLVLGRHAELIPELQALTAAEPLRETLRGRLMRALYGAGRQAEALSVYTDTKRLLADSLGVDPSPDLEAIHLSVLRQDPALRPSPPLVPDAATQPAAPAAVPDQNGPSQGPDRNGPPRGNLRARLTSFIGRDDEVKRVVKLLGESRLVTLTGPGGAGKTRLSLECGERLLAALPDGVWAVELAPVGDPAEVPHTVLAALGLRETKIITPRGVPGSLETADPLDRLSAALGGKRLLVLLDNCEHLLDAAARLAARLLADCPGVRVLATSREPLGITGETLWPVEPLPLPPPHAAPDEAVGYPAVRLFADRAAAVRPGFTVSADNVARIVRICRALDGMPLAIELAAARLRSLTTDQLAARLDDRFRLLTAGSRVALPRHKTLRAVVEWSWELLDDAERALWRRLAVFAGGATVEAAEAVCAGAGLAAADVFEVLSALVDKSLVVLRAEGTGPGPPADDAPRYLMLETIRAYGLERLAESGEADRYRRAHAEYFADLAETAEPRLRRSDQVDWLARLAADHDNLHAALRWTISTGDAALAVRLCASLGWYWWLGGHTSEAGDAVPEVLAMPGLPADQTTAVAAVLAAMSAFGGPREIEEMKGWLRLSRDICAGLDDEPLHPVLRLMGPLLDGVTQGFDLRDLRRIEPLFTDPDPWVASMARFVHGQVALNTGRVEPAEDDFATALEGFRSTGDRWGISFTLTAQAEVLSWRGDHRRALSLLEEALTLVRELGVTEETVQHMSAKLAGELFLLGERDRAGRMLEASLRAAEHTASDRTLAWMHYYLAEFSLRRGEYAEAARSLERVRDLIDAGLSGPPQFTAVVTWMTGRLASETGDLAGARRWQREALRHAVTSMDNPVLALVLTGQAELAWREGDPRRAAELLGMSHAVRGLRDLSQPFAVRLEETLREELGGDAFAAAYERGRSRDLDGVLTDLGMRRPPPPVL